MRITVVKKEGRTSTSGARVAIALVKGTRARWYPGIQFHPRDWDRRRKRVRATAKYAVLINARIDEALARAERAHQENPSLSPRQLRDLLASPYMQGMGFAEAARLDLKDDPPRSWHTREQRKHRINRFEAFAPGIGVEAIDAAFMAKYKRHLALTAGENATASQLRSFRTIYNRVCKRQGMTPKAILEGLDAVERYTKAPVCLTPQEVDRLKEYAEGQTGWKAKAVHMWLFSLYAGGIRWTDLCLLTGENVRDGRVVFTANKTGKPKNVPLHGEAREIVLLYKRKAGTVFGVEPDPRSIVQANVVANKALKSAARACRISKRITTHNARHSFAAWALPVMDDRAIQQILGVDDKAFKHYRSRFGQRVLDEAMGKVFGG